MIEGPVDVVLARVILLCLKRDHFFNALRQVLSFLSLPLDDTLFLLDNEIYNLIFSSQKVGLETVQQTAHACSVHCLVPGRWQERNAH